MSKEKWYQYTLTQIEQLMDGKGYSTLERTDLRDIIDELLIRCRVYEKVVDRF